LLGSLPSLEMSTDQDLAFIVGAPPDMINLPPGCPFWPRCGFRTRKCTEELPELIEVGEAQRSACWHIDRVRAPSTPPWNAARVASVDSEVAA
jgi:oligopeptide transport system ATP-binding protein